MKIVERTTLHVSDDTGRIAMLENRTYGTAANDNNTAATLTRYIYSNHLQSASLELDENSLIISYEEYHPYGTTSYQAMNASIQAVAKRYRYTGKERDEESGLYYHGARYYIPWLCRWCAVDPLESKYSPWSSYNYGFCNPITWNDPTGMGPGDQNHVIQSGETLSGIAKQYGLDVNELAARNGISDPNKIYAGNSLTISGGGYFTVSNLTKEGQLGVGSVIKWNGSSSLLGTVPEEMVPTPPDNIIDPAVTEAIANGLESLAYIAMGAINAWSSNYLMGAGRVDPKDVSQHKAEFAIGQLLGDLFTFETGAAGVSGGAGFGVVTSPTGVGAVAGAGFVAWNVAAMGTSATHIAADIENIMRYASTVEGNSNSGSSDDNSNQETTNPEKPETEQLLELHENKGFKETKEFGRQHGQKVYKYGNKYYSKDVDSHNGGAWKVFEKSGGKLKRTGTADKYGNTFKK